MSREGISLDHSDANMANPTLIFSAFIDVNETITDFANKKYVGKIKRPTTFSSTEKAISS